MPAQHVRTALVTGATRGIGLEISRRLGAAGYKVYLTGRRLAEAEKCVAEAAGDHGDLVPLDLDVADERSIAAAVERLAADGARLDVLVNNAGTIQPIGHAASVPLAEWRRNIEVNLIGSLACFAAFWPSMRNVPEPVLINVSSGAADNFREGWSAYCSAKAGLAMLGRAISAECGPEGLRVYSVRPGMVDTGMQAEIRASGMNPVSQVPRQDLLPASAPARLIVWLADNRPEDLTGAEVDIRDPATRRRAGIAMPGD